MAGRHAARRSHDYGSRRGTGRVFLVLALVVLLVAGGIVTVLILSARRHHNAAGSGPDTSASTCTGQVSVPVITTSTIRSAVDAVARRWDKSDPAVRGHCIRVRISSQDSAAAARSIALDTSPTLWIPNSRMWSDKLAATSPPLAKSVTVGASIGSSPLVVAAAPDKAAALRPAAKAGWAAVLAGSTPVAVTDPATTTPGALIVLGLSTQSGNAPGAAAQIVGLFMRLNSALLPSAEAGVTALQTRPGSAPAFVTSEQTVFLANRRKPTPVVSAVYPSGPTPMLDFPLVQVTPPGSDPLVKAAMAQFERQLKTRYARAQLADSGVRDPSGAPLPAEGTTGISPEQVEPATATVTAAQQVTAQRLWAAADKPSQLLAAIDVSGSMVDDSGNGKSKIQVVTGAAEAALKLLPEDWTVGLWTFSQHSAPDTDWTELVPLGPVKTQRPTLLGAAATLPSHAGGNTGLYDTTLAAFQDVSAHYDPSSVNVVAVLTDGADVDPDSIGLSALLSRLRAAYDPAKPVHIVTIGFGSDADAHALKLISRATEGQSYIVKDPNQILGVILDSIIANNIGN